MGLIIWSQRPSKSTSKQEAGQKVFSNYYDLDFSLRPYLLYLMSINPTNSPHGRHGPHNPLVYAP